MLFRKLWRTMGLYKAQFISMIIMIALGVGMFVGFNMEWYSIDKNTSAFFKETGLADYRIVAESGFSSQDLEKISDIDGVELAARYLSVNADVKGYDGDSVALSVTENIYVSGFQVFSGEEYDENSLDGIWLSDSYAAQNGISPGDSLCLVYKNIEFSGRVAGLIKSGEHMVCVRDESQLMPDFSTFGFAYISPSMYEDITGGDYYPQINIISSLSKKDISTAADDALDKTLLILTKDENAAFAGTKSESEEGKTMGSVLPVLFLLIAVLTMVTTMHRLTVKEKTQIGTLKALGFKDRRIVRHYTSYAFMIGIVGSVLGVMLGYFIAWYIMRPDGMMGTYFDMPQWKLYLPAFCYFVLAGIILLLTLIGFLSVRKMLTGTVSDALAPYTPKKSKPLLIEKAACFRRLSFGTRWNLRDIMRHKSRTAMSLIGTVGCILIIICALGMRDTMDTFLKLYYDDATKYASRIYLSEDASDEAKNEIISKYNGDWSTSVSVQVDEKAVSLDIYNVPRGLVRFPEKKTAQCIELTDDGAYVCMRIADEFDLSPGDSLTVSPYGSSDEYTLTVAGVIRSISEGMVITPEYADSIGLSYSPDSVYTLTEKDSIDHVDSIKSIQSKQMIMDSFDTFMELMNTMIVILILGAVLLGVVVLYNLGIMSYTERYREMATLKVVGFKDKKIGRLLIGQNLWVTVIGIVIGLPLGIATLGYMLMKLAPEYELKLSITPLAYIISILITLGMSLLVSLMVSAKNKRIDMVEALKTAE